MLRWVQCQYGGTLELPQQCIVQYIWQMLYMYTAMPFFIGYSKEIVLECYALNNQL